MNDQHLIQAWVSGRDPDAFKLLCDRYAGLVYATSLRVLRNGPDAEDISQECFVRLAQATNAFRAPLGAWLHRVTVNLCLDRIRSESSRRRREEHYGSQTSETVELTWDDLSVHIDAAINALPETLRETVLQHYMEGRTHQDIADREGVSRAAITQRTQRALALLRDNLKQRGIVAPLAVLSSLLPTGLAEATPIPATLAQRLSKLAMYSAATHSTSSGIAAWLLSVKGMASIATAAVLLGAVVLAWDRLGTQVSPEIDAALPVASATAPEVEQASTPPLEEVTPASAPLTPPPPAQAVAPDTGIVVTGVVREQETKRPLQNVKLVYQRDDGSQEFSYSDEDVLRTDAEGRYKITGLTPGTYKLLCIADWRTQDPGDVQEYLVTLRFAGNRSLQHFQVNETSEQTGPNFEAILGEAVSGTVLDAAGNPVAEANLQLQIMKSSVYVDATTDERGYFKVGGFPLSDQLYLAASKGRPSSVLMEANGEEKLVRPEPGVLVSGVLGPLVVSRGGLTGVEVIVQKGSSVAGRLLDERGAPLAKASVMARSNTQQFFGSRFDMTDDNGDFFFVGLPGAVYDLAWNRPDPKQPSDYPSWTPGEAEVLKRIEVDWDDHVQGLVLKVAAPAIVEGGSITGMVRDTRGKPIGGATIQAIHNHESYESLSKTDGSFVVAQVPSGNCILRVSHPAYSPFYVSEEIAPAGATGLDIVLEDTGVLEGQVLSAETREPVPSFQIAARSWYGEAKLVNDEEGRFRLERVHSGVNAILAQAEGFAESQTELEVAPGATQEGIVVLLEQGNSIAGRVTTDEGLPVENAVIFYDRVPQVPDQRDALALARTDGQGRFTLDHLDKPKGALAAWHDGFPPGIGYFDEGTSELLIELTTHLGAVRGKVLAAGEPVANAKVSLLGMMFIDVSGVDYSTHTPADGTFEFRVVPAGAYRLFAWVTPTDSSAPTDNLRQEILVEAGLETEVLMEFPPAVSTIQGNVTFQGAPPASGLVMIDLETANGGQQYVDQLDAEGAFSLKKVAAGHAELSVMVMPGEGQSAKHLEEFQVGPEQEIFRDIHLNIHGTISGTVSGMPDNKPLQVVVVRGAVQLPAITLPEVVEVTKEAVAQTLVKEGGAFQLPVLATGEYTVMSWYGTPPLEVDAIAMVPCTISESGESPRVTLVLQRP